MELNIVSNSSINNFKNGDLGDIKKLDTAKRVNDSGNNSIGVSVDANNITRRSSLSGEIGKYIDNMSKTGSIISSINNQVQTVNNIQKEVSNLTLGLSTQEQTQPNIAKLISNYNVSVGTINEKMAKLDDLSGDSTTYFDGAAGAIPLGVNMIDNEMSRKREELSSTLERINKVNDTFKKMAQGVIAKEVEIVKQESPFKEFDFGKESVDFSNTRLASVVGSVASSQANAAQAQSVKLLSHS